MTLTAPNPNAPFSTAWVDGLTRLSNGYLQSAVAVSTAAPALTTSYADITGCSVSVTVTAAGAYAMVSGTVLWTCTTLGAGEFFQGILLVDGVQESTGASVVESAQETFNFRNGAQFWRPALSVGVHTLKLQAKKSGASSVGATSNPHCTISVLVVDAT